MSKPDNSLEAREAFDALYVTWAREILDYTDPTTPHHRLKELEGSEREMDLARQILAAPIPLGFLMSRKLDVIAHYMATSGENLSPHDRIVFAGINALRVDVVHFCG
jgi:hypothetical protein